MPQTMLLLFAIILGGQLMLIWQRDGLKSQQNLIRIELESQARGVASEVFEILESKPFDQNMNAVTPEDLTPESDFGTGRTFPGQITDVDDAHEMARHRILRTLTDPNGTPRSLEFWVTAEVAYASDENGVELIQTGGTRTFYKLVTLSIENPQLNALLGIESGLRVARVYAYRD